jgi:hypothetical protein
MTDLERQRLLPIAEAAKQRGVSTKHLLRLVRSEPGAPPLYKLGRRKLGVKAGDLIDWNEASKQPTAA